MRVNDESIGSEKQEEEKGVNERELEPTIDTQKNTKTHKTTDEQNNKEK